MTAGTTTETLLRKLRPVDLADAQALSAGFGWPHRIEDWRFMLDLGDGIAAERDGAVIGTVMTWRYGATHAALGGVCVAPSMQGRGLGRRLVEAALAALGERTVLLNATEAGLPLYSSLGFVATGVVRQQQGSVFNAGLVALPEGERLRPIGRSDPTALRALDRAASGMDRQALIAAVLDAASAGVVLDREGTAVGFALLRRFGHGHTIGPVVAPDEVGAAALISYLLGSHPGQFIRIDVPEESGLAPWLEGLGLAHAGPAVRMVRGADPAGGGAARCFALVSQALG